MRLNLNHLRAGVQRTAGKKAERRGSTLLWLLLFFSSSGLSVVWPQELTGRCVTTRWLNACALQAQETNRFPLASGARAWSVKITTSGGYLGRRGSLIVTSQGEAAAGRTYLYACIAKLSDEEL